MRGGIPAAWYVYALPLQLVFVALHTADRMTLRKQHAGFVWTERGSILTLKHAVFGHAREHGALAILAVTLPFAFGFPTIAPGTALLQVRCGRSGATAASAAVRLWLFVLQREQHIRITLVRPHQAILLRRWCCKR